MNDETNSLQHQWCQRQVGTMMTHPVQVINEGADLGQVEQAFLTYHIRHLPVVDDDNRIVGVITQRDLYRAVSPTRDASGPDPLAAGSLVEDGEHFYDKQRLHDIALEQVMQDRPEVLYPEDPLGKALRLFAARKIGCIPIINQRREVVGILTRHDVLTFFDAVLNPPSHPQN
ncbi:MAG: CBS domain-containing protein [Candidatus Omnitrophica bacterium]|nr:CBS domain-containing protein [Candidatus Omnitrophota bacterium]